MRTDDQQIRVDRVGFSDDRPPRGGPVPQPQRHRGVSRNRLHEVVQRGAQHVQLWILRRCFIVRGNDVERRRGLIDVQYVQLPAGSHELRLVMETNQFNVNYLDIPQQ